MATQVAVITQSTGAQTFYSTYASARTAANSGDTIQIWADLTDEQILLKDGVDIWIAPGRVIDMTLDKPTLTDNDGGYTAAVTCSITGNAILRNSASSSGNCECVKITNPSSKISIECAIIEAVGIPPTESIPYRSVSVYIDNIADDQKFQLICNQVINQYNSAIVFQESSSIDFKNEINIQVQKIQTGLVDDNVGQAGLVLKGTGFIEVDEIICINTGTCIKVEAGNITANIRKLTTKNIENFTTDFVPVVDVSGGDGTQNLILNFDEIQNLKGGDGVRVEKGNASIIGRSIYSLSGLSVNITEVTANDIKQVLIQSDEIISGTKGINIKNSSEQIIIDANYIEGGNGNSGVVKSAAGSNYVLRNAKIKNTYAGSSTPYSRGIFIDSGISTLDQQIELENIIIVTGTGSLDYSIFRAGSTGIEIKNLGLFAKVDKNNLVSFAIGKQINYKFIVSTDIT